MMKITTVLTCLFALLCLSCNDDDDNNTTNETTSVVMLQVDYTSYDFEGGHEFSFSEFEPGFTIASDYDSPDDFGGIKLYYEELNELLFEGSIIWAGTGERSFPNNLENPTDFTTHTDAISSPDFSLVMYSENAFYPENIDYTAIWNAVKNLEIVKTYRNANPYASIQLFLYTPSVGVGDPEEWDYLLFLKK